MKRLLKLGLVALTLVVATVGSVLVLYAADDHGGPGGGHGGQRGRGRFGGEVTAVTSESVTVSGYGRAVGNGGIHPQHSITHTHPLTASTPFTGSVPFTKTAYFTDSTVVRLIECQCDGTLADLTVGDHIDARGVKLSDGTYVAYTITIAPDGDKLGGHVTTVADNTISVISRGGVSGTIIVNDDTKYLTRDGTATLADITAGKKIAGYGVAQDDGSLLARVVLIQGGKAHTHTVASASVDLAASVDSSNDSSITVDSAAIDALVNNLASDADQPVDESATQPTATQSVFLPIMRK